MVKLSPSFRGAVRQFAYWVAKRTAGLPVQEGIDHGAVFEAPSALKGAFAVFRNELEADGQGLATNFQAAERRAAEYICQYCDLGYAPEPPFAGWEFELHPDSPEIWNAEK